jgi:hypothetical protein
VTEAVVGLILLDDTDLKICLPEKFRQVKWCGGFTRPSPGRH